MGTTRRGHCRQRTVLRHPNAYSDCCQDLCFVCASHSRLTIRSVTAGLHDSAAYFNRILDATLYFHSFFKIKL